VLGLDIELDNCEGGPITVDITAEHGQVLGDLLCGIAGLLDGGLPLGDLTGTQLNTLTGAITDVLNQVFGQATQATADNVSVTGNGLLPGHLGDCNILNLEVGEIHLDLLGLNVDTSEICLRVTAEPGQGHLLGNLLCGLSDLLNGGGDLGRIARALNRIAGAIDRLV
jgi:hypothetical protein